MTTDLSKLPDIDLIRLLKDDNRTAYAAIFERYNALLFSHAYRKLNDKDDAKDLIQDIFANLWVKRHQLEIKSSLEAYLFTAIRNKFYDIVSHRKVEDVYRLSISDFMEPGNQVTDHLIREKQFQQIIEEEIQALPPRMRLVFEMSRKQHLSHQEIADQLGISKQTVTDQVKKALKILKPRLLPLILVLISSRIDQ